MSISQINVDINREMKQTVNDIMQNNITCHCYRWENVQEASSSLREGATWCWAKACWRVWSEVQERAMEGSVRLEPH